MIGTHIIDYQKYNFLENRVPFDYNGNIIKDFKNISNATECSRLCNGYKQCSFVQYDNANKTCSLVQLPKDEKNDLYLKMADYQYKYIPNTSFPVKMADQLNKLSLNDCLIECDSDGACSSISYDKTKNVCNKNYYNSIFTFSDFGIKLNKIL